jgi:hypothetical protein
VLLAPTLGTEFENLGDKEIKPIGKSVFRK